VLVVVLSRSSQARRRGCIGWLPSGSARVKVYAGVDQVTGKKMWLRETVPARATRRETEREADNVLTRLLNQVDSRRHPRTEDTVNELLDRWLDVLDVERKTRAGYLSKIDEHVRPTRCSAARHVPVNNGRQRFLGTRAVDGTEIRT
jgi:hypothetical protein